MTGNLWSGLQYFNEGDVFNQKIQLPSIFRSLNYIALFVCLIYPAFLFFSGNMTINFLSLTTCLLPAFLCSLVLLFLHIKEVRIAMFISYALVPISIAIKANYDPVGGIMLYPLAQSIVCFFVMRKKADIIVIYIISMLCFSEITIYYEYLINKNFDREFIFLLFSLLLFITMVYFIFSYVRNTIEKYQKVVTLNEIELTRKNNALKIQNELILAQSSQLEKKQQLLIEATDLQQRISALLSHDIRASVMAFKNIFNAYGKGILSKEELADYVPNLEREADNMNTLFEDILSLSKDEKTSPEKLKEKIDPEVLIKEMCLSFEEVAEKKNIGLEYFISSSKKVHVNPKFVKIILRNLISNAIKFTRPGGNIRISSSSKENSRCTIIVQDNGEGMSAEKLEKIRKGVGLTSKGTSNEPGTGLGLSFCREFVSKCGGTLEVNSNLGKGTTFSFTLPLAE